MRGREWVDAFYKDQSVIQYLMVTRSRRGRTGSRNQPSSKSRNETVALPNITNAVVYSWMWSYGFIVFVWISCFFFIYTVFISKLLPKPGHQVGWCWINRDVCKPGGFLRVMMPKLLNCTHQLHSLPHCIQILDWIHDDNFYGYLIPTLLPMTIYFVFYNWLGLKLFRHS